MSSNNTSYCLSNGNVIFTNAIAPNLDVLIRENKIFAIQPHQPTGITRYIIIDATDKYISPGFIDVHIQGCGGADFLDDSDDALETISRTSASGGTTSILATTTIRKNDNEFSHLKRLKKVVNQNIGGAKIIGVHLEGPYINEKMKGGFSTNFVKKQSVKEFKNILDILGSDLKMITLAPEVDKDFKITKLAHTQGIIVSIGHSEADYELTKKAFESGVTHVTHLFNAMRGLHHREPGIIGAALTDNNVSVQIIADGYHLHKTILKIIYKLKKRDKIILITDGTAPTGLKEGMTFEGVGGTIKCEKGAIKLKDGTLAGSALLMNQMVRSLINLADISIKDAIYIASIAPAKLLGIDATKGSIARGKDADITILDKDLNVIETFVEGKRICNASFSSHKIAT